MASGVQKQSTNLPTDEDLGRRLFVLLGDVHDPGILQDDRLLGGGPRPIGRSEGTVSGDDDVVLLAELQHLLLGEVRMALDLVGHRLDLE